MANPWDQFARADEPQAAPRPGPTVRPVFTAPQSNSQVLGDTRTQQQINSQPLQDANAQADLIRKGRDAQFANLEQSGRLVDDYRQDPAVKNYTSAIGVYGAALNRQPTPTGDLALIYDFAKVMDPGSVVREGEMALATSASPVVAAIGQRFEKELAGGGTLPDETRKGLKREMAAKMAAMNQQFIQARVQYKQKAERFGLNPADVVGEHPGLPFQDAESRLLGRDIPQADYEGNVQASPRVGGTYEGGSTLADPDAKTGVVQIPAEMQAEYASWMRARGREFDPADYANMRLALDARFGFGVDAGTYEKYLKEGQRYKDPSVNINLTIPGVERSLSQTEQGLNSAAQSDVGAGIIGLANGLSANTVQLAMDPSQKAAMRQNAEEHWKSNLAGEMLGASALPFGRAATPMQLGAASAGYGFVSGASAADGDIGDRALAGLTSAAVGGALGYGGGRLIQRLTKEKPPIDPGSTPGGKYARAQEFGIDLSPGDVGGMASKLAERKLDYNIFSGSLMDDARGIKLRQSSDAAEGIAAKAGTTSGNFATGKAIQTLIKDGMARMDAVHTRMYDAIPINGAKPGKLPNTIDYLKNMASKFESNPEFAALKNDPRWNAELDALIAKTKSEQTGILDASGKPITRDISTKGGLSWDDLKAYRTDIGERIGEALIGESGTRSELRGLYGALSEDMRAIAKANGKGALEAFDRANAQFKRDQDKIEGAFKSFVGDDLDKAPEAAANRLRAIVTDGKATSNIRDLATIRGTATNEEWAGVQAGVIRMIGQVGNAEGRAFSPSTFINTYDNMAPKAKNLLFGRDNKPLREELDKFSEVMRDIAKADGTRNTSGTALAMGTSAFGGIGATGVGAASGSAFGPVGMAVGALLANTAAAGANYSAARLWTNPKFVRWATGYTKMMRGAAKRGVAPDHSAQMKYLGRVARSTPAIAPDIMGLQSALESAFGSTPARLAANPEQQSGGER